MHKTNLDSHLSTWLFLDNMHYRNDEVASEVVVELEKEHTELVAQDEKNYEQLIEELYQMGVPHCANNNPRSNFIIWNLSTCIFAEDYLDKTKLYPIQLRVWFSHPCIVEKLLKRWHEDAFVKTMFGETTLHLEGWNAHQCNNRESTMRLLLKCLNHSPNVVNIFNHDRQSPLHIPVINGSQECVEVLLRWQQLKVNERNWKGYIYPIGSCYNNIG